MNLAEEEIAEDLAKKHSLENQLNTAYSARNLEAIVKNLLELVELQNKIIKSLTDDRKSEIPLSRSTAS